MPRAKFLQRALTGAHPPKPVSMPQRQVKAPPTKDAFDPEAHSPSNFSKYSQQLLKSFDKAVEKNEPHFRLGGKEVYFPHEQIVLMRNTAKMTPYQAQFQVPLHFNKLELRDYLWNIYGLRALNITTQIKWSEWTRTRMSRYRTPQVKKMIIDMDQPFMWPEKDEAALKTHKEYCDLEMNSYREEMQYRQGSDLKKPAKAFDGLMGPYPEPARSFIPKKIKRELVNEQLKAEKQDRQRKQLDLLQTYLKL